MKTAILNFMKIGESSIIASNRIALYLAEKTGSVLIDRKAAAFGEFERIFLVNGPGLYCDYLKEMQAMVEGAREVIWVGNDYAIKMPGFVKKHPNLHHFSAYENIYESKKHRLVNWNALTFNESIPERAPKIPGLAYYGAYRKDRECYFDKYLGSGRSYPVTVSSSKNGIAKFTERFGKISTFDGSNLLNTLGRFESTLYIEDRKSHKIYCSPANRFYEALSARTLILFDRSCEGTFRKAGIDISDWVVNSAAEYADRLRYAKDLRAAQIKKLRAINYSARLDVEFNEAMDAL